MDTGGSEGRRRIGNNINIVFPCEILKTLLNEEHIVYNLLNLNLLINKALKGNGNE